MSSILVEDFEILCFGKTRSIVYQKSEADEGFLEDLTSSPPPPLKVNQYFESEQEEDHFKIKIESETAVPWIHPEHPFSRIDGGTLTEKSVGGETMLTTQKLMMELDEHLQRTRESLDKLSADKGMDITQENGQRRYGPPKGSTFLPPKGSEVFVGKIPRDCIEPELVPVFERAGKIYELRLMMDFSGTNRGYCFVQYHTAEEAKNAVRLLNHFEIRKGRFIGVTKSVDNCRLFIGGIPVNKTKEEVVDEINQITEGVVKANIYPSLNDKSKNRGFAFVEYESHKAAAMARRKMIPGKIQMWGKDVAVDWAEPQSEQIKREFKRQNAPKPQQYQYQQYHQPQQYQNQQYHQAQQYQQQQYHQAQQYQQQQFHQLQQYQNQHYHQYQNQPLQGLYAAQPGYISGGMGLERFPQQGHRWLPDILSNN